MKRKINILIESHTKQINTLELDYCHDCPLNNIRFFNLYADKNFLSLNLVDDSLVTS